MVVQRGEKKRRRFAGNARDRQQYAGDDSRTRRAPGHLPDDMRTRRPECHRRLAQGVWNEQKHVLRGAHHDGNYDHGQHRRTRPRRKMPNRKHDDFVDEKAQHDRGRREKDVVDEAHHRRKPGMPAIFRQVGTGKNADGRADCDGKRIHQKTSDNRIEQSAIFARRRCVMSVNSFRSMPENPL